MQNVIIEAAFSLKENVEIYRRQQFAVNDESYMASETDNALGMRRITPGREANK